LVSNVFNSNSGKINSAIKGQRKPKRKSVRIYYLLLSVILIICLIQGIRGLCLNVAKFITLNKKLEKLHEINISAKIQNRELKSEIKNYTSPKGIESLARDNLNMVGKNEVLVLIKNQPKKL
jgi:cell division protein FtsB